MTKKEILKNFQKKLKEQIDWLKSLKDRVSPQNFAVTDEDLAQAKKDAYNDALDKIEYHSGEPTFDDGWSAAIDYIKKKSLRPQPKNEWSEEDERCLTNAIDACNQMSKVILTLLSGSNPSKTDIL